MRATVMYGAADVRVEDVPDARLIEPTDALVNVGRAGICGSDLWPYKTMEHSDGGRRMGHEFVGVVEDVGADVRTVKASLLTLSDVIGTGHHAAVSANVGPGMTAAVVGDGAVGLCGVIAAKRLGAEQIVVLGRLRTGSCWRGSSARRTSSASGARRRSSACASLPTASASTPSSSASASSSRR